MPGQHDGVYAGSNQFAEKVTSDGFYGERDEINADLAYSTTSPAEQLRSDSSLSECCLCYTTHGSRHASRSHRPSKTIQIDQKQRQMPADCGPEAKRGLHLIGLHFMPSNPSPATRLGGCFACKADTIAEPTVAHGQAK